MISTLTSRSNGKLEVSVAPVDSPVACPLASEGIGVSRASERITAYYLRLKHTKLSCMLVCISNNCATTPSAVPEAKVLPAGSFSKAVQASAAAVHRCNSFLLRGYDDKPKMLVAAIHSKAANYLRAYGRALHMGTIGDSEQTIMNQSLGHL